MYDGMLVENNLFDVQVHEGIVASNDRRSTHNNRQMPIHNKMQHPEYQTFDKLNPFRIHWNIKARVCRIWHQFQDQRSSHQKTIMKVLLIDEKSDQMLLTLEDNEIKSFGKNLREGTIFYIKQVKVVDASKTYRIVPGDFQLCLRQDSRVEEIIEDCNNIPSDRFHFKNFDQLPQLVNKIEQLIDVIGIVVNVSGVSTIRKRDNTMTQKLDVTIIDARAKSILMTLWEEILSFYKEQLSCPATIGKDLIATSVLVREFNGNLYLSSSYSTKLILDSEIDEAKHLRTWYADNKELRSTTPITDSNHKRATIAEWKSLRPDSATSNVVVGIKATISRSQLDQKIWYLACIKCGKKTLKNEENNYCPGCNLSSTETYPRYIMRLTLTDHTDTANVVLFDNEVAQLLQTSKDELSSLIADENEADKVAEKIRSILWKSFIFYLKMNGNGNNNPNQACPIKRISEINYAAESKRLLSLISNR
ncbi:replication protein A DNA-binding subunit B isoform X1 [Cinnamomum micranthum f. kanehirae]|uniref:Replication protein A DNA-binding subunit B isoform X1 n=1 Tax=Cinnamomum micranthum f. kanehirae TaxID=337451 RepID=A0A443NE29_9MAGN|nr:replication protein A DNA-binding subunit B isoform X1 [Cinnamomum micranthum f. kanehirae]